MVAEDHTGAGTIISLGVGKDGAVSLDIFLNNIHFRDVVIFNKLAFYSR
jgi:hypothetical protein